MDFTKYYGTHLSKSKGLTSVLDTLRSFNLKVCQIFTKSPQSAKAVKTKLDPVEKIGIDAEIKKHGYRIYIHSQYILNLCRSDLTYAVPSIISDFDYLDTTIGVVIHMGKDTQNLGKDLAFNNMKNNILKILSHISGTNKYLILETSVKSKNDSCSFYSIEGLANLYIALEKHQNIKFCIDTCHIFASGYNVSNLKLFNEYISKFDKLIGKDNIILFHLNDSKSALNSGVDRHEQLGKGKIFNENEDVLKKIITFCVDNKIDMVTETPDTLDNEIKYLEKLFSN